MADTKIKDLTAYTTPLAADVIPLHKTSDDTDKKVTVANLAHGINTANGIYNVMDYGAVGNGVTDDTAAIQSIATAIIHSGGIVYFPAGIYKVTSTITWNIHGGASPIGLHIYGAGASSEILYTATDGTDCFHFLYDVVGTATLHIHDMSLIGAGAAETTGNGIRLQRCIMPAMLNNLNINKFGGGAGIYLESCWMPIIDNYWSQECNYGIYIKDDPIGGGWGAGLNTTIRNSQLQSCNLDGIWMETGFAIVENCIIEGNGGGGVVCHDSKHIILRNIYFELNNDTVPMADIYFDNTDYTEVSHCISGDAAPNPALTFINACVWSKMEQNEFVGIVDLSGLTGGTTFVTSYTTDGNLMNHIGVNSQAAFAADDATPSVMPNTGYQHKLFYTANVNPTTITDFHDGYSGQEILVLINDALTTIDFSGTYLKGNGGIDYVASNGDLIKAVKYSATNWYCTIVEVS